MGVLVALAAGVPMLAIAAVMVFVVAAAWTLAGDMQQVHRRWHDAYLTGKLDGMDALGPRLAVLAEVQRVSHPRCSELAAARLKERC